MAIGQRNLKRMFAYGGISHVGLVLIGVGQANQTGLTGAMYYLLNDAVMQCALFMLAGFLAVRYGASSLDELGRAHVRNPWAIVAFVAVGLGMVGLPPTGGFFGKLRILLGALEADNHIAAAAVVLTTLITLGYFAQVFERLVRSGSEGAAMDRTQTPWSLRATMAALVAAIVGLGIWNDQVVRLLMDATAAVGM
jgi:multicomponent Na+:H+ antiporter subunit D